MTKLTTQQNIPKGWKQVALGDLLSVTTGKRDANHGSPDGQYPFFTCAQKVSKIDNFAFDTEAVLIAGNGDFNVKYYKGKFDAYQRTYVLSGFKDTTGFFVYQKAKQALNEIIKNNQGSSVKFIKMGDLTDYPLLLPPIEEQQKIAEILGTVDEDIAKTQEVIEATEKLKRGLMQQLFTRGIGHTKFKETEFGEIPTEWNYKKLNEITRQITDGTHRTPKYTQEGIPFLRVTDIQTEKIDWSDIKHISIEEHKELIKRCKPEKGDVLLSKNGTIGITKVVDWDEEFSIFVSLCLIKPDTEQISAEYLCEILRSDFTLNQVKMRSKQGTVTNLHLVEIRDFDIPVPKISEQKKIIEILSATDEKISINKKLKEKLILLKKGLMQDLLSGKVRTTI